MQLAKDAKIDFDKRHPKKILAKDPKIDFDISRLRNGHKMHFGGQLKGGQAGNNSRYAEQVLASLFRRDILYQL